MMKIISGIFILLHGLVHFWYVVLSQRWVDFKPEMGWSGKSWLLSGFVGDSTLRSFASGLFALAAIGFLISGIGILASASWWRTAILIAAVFSMVILLAFWDGDLSMIVQKGLLGVLLDVGIILFVMLRNG